MIELDLKRKLIAHEDGHEPFEIDGFKLVDPDGVTLFVGQRTVTLPLSDVRIAQQ